MNETKFIKTIIINNENNSEIGKIFYYRLPNESYNLENINNSSDERNKFKILTTGRINQESYPNDNLDESIVIAIKEYYPNSKFFNRIQFSGIDYKFK